MPQSHHDNEATVVLRIKTQSPSTLGWRLRVEPRHTGRFEERSRWAHRWASLDPAAAGPLPEERFAPLGASSSVDAHFVGQQVAPIRDNAAASDFLFPSSLVARISPAARA